MKKGSRFAGMDAGRGRFAHGVPSGDGDKRSAGGSRERFAHYGGGRSRGSSPGRRWTVPLRIRRSTFRTRAMRASRRSPRGAPGPCRP